MLGRKYCLKTYLTIGVAKLAFDWTVGSPVGIELIAESELVDGVELSAGIAGLVNPLSFSCYPKSLYHPLIPFHSFAV